MPLPHICFSRIGALAEVAARIDEQLIRARIEGSESYGRSTSEHARITLTLAVYQCHIEKGIPLDSPRLSGIVNWLRNRSVDSSQFMIAPLRLIAEGVLGTTRSQVEQDISLTLSDMRDRTARSHIDKPILLLVSLEALEMYGINARNNNVCFDAMRRATQIMSAPTELPATRAYAASLLARCDGLVDESSLLSDIEGVLDQQEGGGWRDCIVETSYIILNLADLTKISSRIKDSTTEALEFIKKTCSNGVPSLRFIHNVPDELKVGGDAEDLQTYASAVAVRALLRSINQNRAMSCLEFAHAAWKRHVAALERELTTLRNENKLLLSQAQTINTDMQAMASQLGDYQERESKSGSDLKRINKQNVILKRLLTLVASVILILSCVTIPFTSAVTLQVIQIVGALASVVALVGMYVSSKKG